MGGEKTYALKTFYELLQKLYCIGYDEFTELYKKLFGRLTPKSYIDEKWDLLQRRGPSGLICHLDYETTCKIITHFFGE